MEQQIVFRIKQQRFAVPISAADKINQLENVTQMPDVSEYVMGVMDVEGRVLPVIDLPNRLFNDVLENAGEAQVLIVNWKTSRIGLAVDEVMAVQSFDAEQVDQESDKVSVIDDSASPVSAFIRTEDGIVLALDINQLFEEKGDLELQALLEPEREAAAVSGDHEQ
ncbi:chemotaxis protein CheW [Atopococcus tabaci]|uniref:chemotaxis protein CheW n=1 Tax=Atopococcus tabaci TaxID=269774 RepID=UPI000409AEE7|nr:chemotaxis protein CheW [Atopococcus tabaci]